jgi:hypothetical protein
MPGRFGRRLGRACGPLGPAPSARGGSGCRQGPAPTARYQTGAGICNFFGGVSSFRGSVFAGPHPRPLPPAQTGVPFPAGRRDGTQKLLTPQKKLQIPRMVWYRPPLGCRRSAAICTYSMFWLYSYDSCIISQPSPVPLYPLTRPRGRYAAPDAAYSCVRTVDSSALVHTHENAEPMPPLAGVLSASEATFCACELKARGP